MRYPPTLFGIPMTEGIWALIIIAAAAVALVFVLKVFKTIIKDFASGVLIFLLIIVFGFIFVNLISGKSSIESEFGNWFTTFFQ